MTNTSKTTETLIEEIAAAKEALHALNTRYAAGQALPGDYKAACKLSEEIQTKQSAIRYKAAQAAK